MYALKLENVSTGWFVDDPNWNIADNLNEATVFKDIPDLLSTVAKVEREHNANVGYDNAKIVKVESAGYREVREVL